LPIETVVSGDSHQKNPHLDRHYQEAAMKLLLVAVTVLISYSLGVPSYAPLLDSSLGISKPQQERQEASTEVKAAISKLSSSNPRDRVEAACTLGEARATAAIPDLIKLLADDTAVEQPVCGQDKHRGNEGDEPPKTTPGEMAAVALSRMKCAAVEPLIGALRTGVWQARSNAAFALGLIRDSRTVEPLIAATRDPEWPVRAKAAWSLGLVGDERAVEPLTLSLKDPEWKVRTQAAWALGLKGDSRAVEGLIAALIDPNPKVQSQAAWALGLKGDERAVEPLALALTAQGDHVRSQAAWALGLKGDERSVTPLIAALRDTDAQVRSQAAWALGLKGDRRAIEPLKEALNDSNEHVRKQAAWALKLRGLRGDKD
jgi:HEAT repeat protein